jgi:hypothetical protein
MSLRLGSERPNAPVVNGPRLLDAYHEAFATPQTIETTAAHPAPVVPSGTRAAAIPKGNATRSPSPVFPSA